MKALLTCLACCIASYCFSQPALVGKAIYCIFQKTPGKLGKNYKSSVKLNRPYVFQIDFTSSTHFQKTESDGTISSGSYVLGPNRITLHETEPTLKTTVYLVLFDHDEYITLSEKSTAAENAINYYCIRWTSAPYPM